MNHARKVLLIGWDAADWKVIHKLMDEGKMPNVKKLVEDGVMGNMATLFPSLSPMLWTTIATGKRPYKHGIHGFTEPAPDGKSVRPMTNISRKCKAIWNILNQHEKKSLVVGWWPSNPVEPINGVMVSDFFHKSPKRPDVPFNLPKNCVHPASLLEPLSKVRLHPTQLRPKHILPFVPHAQEIDQDTDSRLSGVMKVMCECVSIHRAASLLLQTQEWDFAAVYYDAIDHFSHGFMRYHPPRQEHISEEDFRMFGNVINQCYIYHDAILGDLLKIVDDDVTVLLMSDHGFHPDHLRPKAVPTEPAGPAIEHRDFGIFVAKGPGIKKDHITHGAGLCDITPTILSLYDLPIGEDMDGRPLTDIFEDPPEINMIPSWEEVAGNDGQHPEGTNLDPGESKEALEQLIALGYIDRPDEDSDVAVNKCQCELDYNVARAYMDGGLFGEAIPLLVNLYNQFPLEFRFGLQLSNCLKAMGRMAELEQLVDDLNKRWRVATKEAKTRIRDVALDARERKKHWQELKKIDEENSEKGEAHSKLARVNARGKPVLFSDPERGEIRKLKAIARGNPRVLDFLSGTIAATNGNFEKALELLEQAGKGGPKDAGYHFQLGNVYLGLKRVEEAQEAFGKALEIDQFHPNALMGLCRSCIEMERYDKAIDFGRQAIGLNYHFPVSHFFLGQAMHKSGDVDGAIESLETALEQNPNFAEAHELLAELHAGDKDLASQHEAAAEALKEEIQDYSESHDPIQLIPVGNLDFSQIIPQLVSQNSSEFLRCLAQPKPIADGELAPIPTDGRDVVIVSGLPRSGTSMMMQMLNAGGIEPFTDSRRTPDDSNPRGYYESQLSKGLASHNSWVEDCQGKVVKVIAPLIPFLPQQFGYKVVLMIRDLEEIIESQEKMLKRLDRPGGDLTADRFRAVFEIQLQTCRNLFRIHRIPHVEIAYSKVVSDPVEAASRLNEFLGSNLQLEEMARAVDPNLYREKKQS